MKTYNKRIGFLVSYQTLVPHGGIGQFTKSFIRLMEENNVKVDIITDKKPQDNEFIKSLNTNIIYPEESYGYTNHSAIFMYGDSYCYERMANFRTASVEALEHNLYDALICNTYETVQVASTMGLEDVIQIIAYTHLESQIFKDTKNPFLFNTNVAMRYQLSTPNIDIGTQSKFNQLHLDESSYHLPIPITEKDLLEEHHKSREGILFVGRWEEGKNPELFLDLIEQTKLPAKVMTSANGAKKFEERLQKIGVPYDIRVGIIGKEKKYRADLASILSTRLVNYSLYYSKENKISKQFIDRLALLMNEELFAVDLKYNIVKSIYNGNQSSFKLLMLNKTLLKFLTK